jgi:hypothetical protein
MYFANEKINRSVLYIYTVQYCRGKNYLETKMRRIIQRYLVKKFLSSILCKGSISRDFRFQVFILYESFPLGP